MVLQETVFFFYYMLLQCEKSKNVLTAQLTKTESNGAEKRSLTTDTVFKDEYESVMLLAFFWTH